MTTRVTRPLLDSSLRVEYPIFGLPAANGTYPMYLVAPTDGTIVGIYFQCDAATSVTFNVDIEGTPVSWTTAAGTSLTATTSVGTDTAASANTFSAGDGIQVDITGTGGSPTILSGQLVISIPTEDA